MSLDPELKYIFDTYTGDKHEETIDSPNSWKLYPICDPMIFGGWCYFKEYEEQNKQRVKDEVDRLILELHLDKTDFSKVLVSNGVKLFLYRIHKQLVRYCYEFRKPEDKCELDCAIMQLSLNQLFPLTKKLTNPDLNYLIDHGIIHPYDRYDEDPNTWIPAMNLNDTFMCACADMEYVLDSDLPILRDVHEKYNSSGTDAVVCLKRQYQPLDPGWNPFYARYYDLPKTQEAYLYLRDTYPDHTFISYDPEEEN